MLMGRQRAIYAWPGHSSRSAYNQLVRGLMKTPYVVAQLLQLLVRGMTLPKQAEMSAFKMFAG